MKLLLIAALACVSAFGQSTFSYVATTSNTVLVATATRATIQQPSSNSAPVIFPEGGIAGATVYCSAACVASVIIGGSTATATAGTVNPTVINAPPNFFNFFTASDSTGGTTLVTHNIQAGQTLPIYLGAMRLGGANSKISIAIASVTATVNITFYPLEIHQ